MKKKVIVLVLVCMLCAVALCSCSNNVGGPSTYQDYFDLGMRYLSEGNYQEAIIAFTAAIEIEPRQVPAYVKRGDAYVLSGETEPNLEAAKADYEKAIALDETNVEAYLGLAEVYIRQGNYEMAQEVLRRGLEKSGYDQRISSKLEEIESNSAYNEYGATEFTRRSGYHTFESLSEEEQLLIIEMAECAQSGNYDAILQVANKIDLGVHQAFL